MRSGTLKLAGDFQAVAGQVLRVRLERDELTPHSTALVTHACKYRIVLTASACCAER